MGKMKAWRKAGDAKESGRVRKKRIKPARYRKRKQ
jgi:hypothetical protein